MRRILIQAGLALAVLALLLPARASALLELDMGFDPAQVCPGDQVQFFFALENVGTTAETVIFTVNVQFGQFTVGPFTAQFPLAAGEQIAREFTFMVPPPAPPGILTMTATAEDSGGIVEAVAELEILDCESGGSARNGRQLLNTVAKELRAIGLR